MLKYAFTQLVNAAGSCKLADGVSQDEGEDRHGGQKWPQSSATFDVISHETREPVAALAFVGKGEHHNR